MIEFAVIVGVILGIMFISPPLWFVFGKYCQWFEDRIR